MAINLIPYGLLPNGNYGINLDDNSPHDPIAAALEVLDVLPPVADADNFPGRLVFSKTDVTIFLFIDNPANAWIPLEGVPATVGDSTHVPPFDPPIIGSEATGELYWTLDTEVLFVWDGFQWQAAGGRYATQVTERNEDGDGLKVVFPAGITSAVPSEYVEVFIDGVRQISLDTADPAGSGDYVIAGTNVVFVVAPVPGADVFIRSMESVQVIQNTEVTERVEISALGQDTFSTGVAGTDPAGIIVSVEGFMQVSGLANDYTISQADTTIVSITKAFAGDTTATVVTTDVHGITVAGTVVNIDGTLPSDGYNSTFVVSGSISPNQYNITVPPGTALTATADPTTGSIMFFDPPFFEDTVVFNPGILNPGGGQKIYIKSFKNLIVAPSQGEANTLVLEPGAVGETLVGTTAVAPALGVKGIAAGSNISINATPTDLVITASTGANFETRIAANTALIFPGDSVSYVGVLDTSIPGPNIVVDLSTSGVGVGGQPTSGRKITIKDEGGLASIRNIEVAHTGDTFDGLPSPYVISTNRGSVTLVYDGVSNWNITAEKI